MAVRNVEIRKNGEGYSILEQAGSDPHRDQPTHEAASRADAESWLKEQGGDSDRIARVLDEAAASGPVFLELSAEWSEAERFPRR